MTIFILPTQPLRSLIFAYLTLKYAKDIQRNGSYVYLHVDSKAVFAIMDADIGHPISVLHTILSSNENASERVIVQGGQLRTYR